MSIEKMEFLTIVGVMKDLDRVLEKCVESGCFHMTDASKETSGNNEEFIRLDEENPYKDLLKRIVDINIGENFSFHEVSTDDILAMTTEDIDSSFTQLEKEFKIQSDEIYELNSKIKECRQAMLQMKHLKGMHIDLERLLNCSHIKVRFGRLPCESYLKLSYYDNKTFIFMPYDDDGNYKWGFYLAPIDSIKETDNIFKSLYFERIWLPDFVTGTPEEEYSNLSRKIEKMEEKKSIAVECRSRMISEKGELVNKYFCRIKYLYDLFEMRRNVTVYKEKFYMTGFVPKKCIEEFKKLFDSINTVSLVIKPAGEGNIEKTPVKLKNNSFSKPFSMFVEMYGLPSYNGFNPTMLVAVTYTLLFGIMFGDLGQGLVISLVGYFVYRKKGNLLGAILQRVGLSSAFFGLVYGSVFGFEHALDPLYKSMGLKHKPLEIMDNTMVILLGAIVIGIVIILISIIINIFISLKHRDYSEALFGNNGIAGLILFSSLLAGVAVMMIGNGSLFTAPYVICLIVIPLVIMFFREPLGCLVSGKKFKLESGIGDFIASNFFEVFEFILGYATNTLSFVRIGGFIFSHAGMMSVVMLLSESVSAGASPVVVVIGNIFVMGMEGLIVGIQVLRLEFYEVFSRFYDGDGQPFEPVKINYDKNID
ncbi:MAG: V-type ATP synthase subunit I [Oscillospiraceae bacterium]|jgi:V/A-type H+-transporting ATPase subunit I|nr:ATPase [Ruminococcus sp.]